MVKGSIEYKTRIRTTPILKRGITLSIVWLYQPILITFFFLKKG
jgi:hypothetical protein